MGSTYFFKFICPLNIAADNKRDWFRRVWFAYSNFDRMTLKHLIRHSVRHLLFPNTYSTIIISDIFGVVIEFAIFRVACPCRYLYGLILRILFFQRFNHLPFCHWYFQFLTRDTKLLSLLTIRQWQLLISLSIFCFEIHENIWMFAKKRTYILNDRERWNILFVDTSELCSH